MIKIDAQNVDFHYGDFHALKNISMQIEANTSVAFIGPSGCGKSTFLRLFNRMNDLIPDTRLEGKILLMDGTYTAKGKKSIRSVKMSEWYFRNRTRSQRQSSKMWLTVYA